MREGKLEGINPTCFYNKTEASKALHIHRHTLDRWIKAGDVKIVLRKTRTYIKGTEIIRANNTM